MAAADDLPDEWKALRRDRIVAAVVAVGWGLPMTVWASFSAGLLAGLVVMLLVLPFVVLGSIFTVARLTKAASSGANAGVGGYTAGMGIGISLFLIAVGAVVTFAVEVDKDTGGVNFDTIGVILMVVGAIGLLASLTIFGSWGSRGRDDVVIEERRGP